MSADDTPCVRHGGFYCTAPECQPTGAADMPPGLPQVAHGDVVDADGAAPHPTPTREEVPSIPDVPHSGEQPTPVQRRDAWLEYHAYLVGEMEEHLRGARAFLPYAVRPEGMTNLLAREWAALQLLKALRDMKAPEVPVDDTLGQATLEEALDDGMVWECGPHANVWHGHDARCRRIRKDQ